MSIIATPPLRNWHDAAAYGFTQHLSVRQWAWEFLRRNSAYQADWQRFDRRWQALEAAYGRPPNRDFQAWKQDPRAYVTVDDAHGDCRIDQDKVLIECWMGDKWGFYKFPLDPATDNPVTEQQLVWRDLVTPVIRVTADDKTYLGESAERIAIGFELDLSLKEQIRKATRYLQARQSGLRRNNQLAMRSRTRLAHDWCLMLRYLDGHSLGVDEAELENVLSLQVEYTDWDTLRDSAHHLVTGNHQSLLAVIDV